MNLENFNSKKDNENEQDINKDKSIVLRLEPEQNKFLRENGVDPHHFNYIPLFIKAGIIDNVEEYIAVIKWPEYSSIISEINKRQLNDSIEYLKQIKSRFESEGNDNINK